MVVVPGTALIVVALDRRGIGLVSNFLIKIHLQGVDGGVIVIGFTNSEEGCRTHLKVHVGGQARSCWKKAGQEKSKKSGDTNKKQHFVRFPLTPKYNNNNYHVCIAVKWM